MNNDDQKIIWKKGVSGDKSSDTTSDSSENSGDLDLQGDVVSDLSRRSADYQSQSKSKKIDGQNNEEKNIFDLKSEIEQALGKKASSPNQKNSINMTQVDVAQSKEKTHLNLDDLKNDINNLFDKNPTQKAGAKSDLKTESVAGSAAMTAAMAAINKSQKKEKIIRRESVDISNTTKKDSVLQKTENHSVINKKDAVSEEKESIDKIKESIHADLKHPLLQDKKQGELEEVRTAKLLEEKKQKKGVGQTYYSDLSTAMGANDPKTMSELLRKARFERKEKQILSPRSKKNIAYIVGALALLIGSFVLIGMFFGKKEEVQYITEKRVKALVYADKDTGINATGIEAAKTRQAIRKVVETKIDQDTLHHIYYAGKDQIGNMRRLGIKQVLDSTNNKPPQLLYENITNDFMHGVYKTDKNHPFMILKAKSYDRALEGMKLWEPSMIDDLSAYFDLPKEAGNRSLIKDGFSDDLINNKIVRVARFLPRDVDKRNGIFDLFDKNKKESSKTNNNAVNQSNINNSQGQGTVDSPEENSGEKQTASEKVAFLLKDFIKKKIINSAKHAFAQIQFQTQDGGFIDITSGDKNGKVVCYKTVKKCIYTGEGRKKGKTVSYDDEPDKSKLSSCYSEIINQNDDDVFGPEKSGQPGYICQRVLQTNNAISQIPADLKDRRACFDRVTGNRVEFDPKSKNAKSFCFPAYQCKAYVCHRDGKVVDAFKSEGRPGVSCEETEVIPIDKIDSYSGRKICKPFPGVLSLTNLNSKNICFDSKGTYVEGPSVDKDGNLLSGYSCINPINRDETMCLTNSGKIVFKDPNIPYNPNASGGPYLYCFSANENATSRLDKQFEPTEKGFKKKALMLGVELKALALLLKVTSVKPELVSKVNKTADLFLEIAARSIQDVTGQEHVKFENILHDGEKMEIIGFIRNLEIILNQLESANPKSRNSKLIKRLREAILMIKEGFGLAHNTAWVTLGNGYPNGIPLPEEGVIYPEKNLDADEFVVIDKNDINPNTKVIVAKDLDPDALVRVNGKLVAAKDLDPDALIQVNKEIDTKNLEIIDAVQQSLSLIGLMDPVSISGRLDLVTQDAISSFQSLNGLLQTGVIDAATIRLINSIISGKGSLYDGAKTASINDYFKTGNESSEIGIGTYSAEVQALQMILYAEDYDIASIDGLYDTGVCKAVRKYQEDNNLEVSLDQACTVNADTLNSLNGLIRTNGYLGSGFALNPNGYLQGTGALRGKFGPGAVDFSVNTAEADSLKEGDIVLMYTFLDEETILITRHQSVMNEIIQRRALDDIFNKNK